MDQKEKTITLTFDRSELNSITSYLGLMLVFQSGILLGSLRPITQEIETLCEFHRTLANALNEKLSDG